MHAFESKRTMNWHYLDNGAQRGPISEADFVSLVQQGVITSETFLWCEGMAEWSRYDELTSGAPEPAGASATSKPGVAAYASPLLRVAACAVDCFVAATVLWIGLLGAKWVLSRTVSDARAATIIGVTSAAVLVLWLIDYFTGRVARNGCTFGQSLFGMQVVGMNGARISFLRSLGRFAVLLLANQITLAIGQVVAFFDQQKRGLHDIVCGTVVLKK
jgi:uncharacterized RDD family membrane protein YckC